MAADVTFIVPIYNGARYLDSAVQSIISQTESSWRMILVDDGSSDGSFEQLATLHDERITKFQNASNMGLYASLNRAIDHTSTKWVAILMQDDVLKVNYLREMLTVAAKEPDVKIIWATEDTIDRSGQLMRRGRDTSRLELIPAGRESWRSVVLRDCIWTISGSITSREVFRAYPFRRDLPHRADYEWLLRVIQSYDLLYFERPLLELRIHDGQASSANLASGRDIAETVSILREALSDPSVRISYAFSIRAAVSRASWVIRRFIVATLRGRFRDARRYPALLVGLIGVGLQSWRIPRIVNRVVGAR